MYRTVLQSLFVPLALTGALLDTPAQAQEYPSKPVTIILVLAAGTGLDVAVRTWGAQLTQTLGKQVVIENRPGADGILAVNAVKSAPADGHTLLVATSGALAINQTIYKQLPYDPAKDFVPASLYVKSPFVLVVHPSLPVRSASELVTYVKARPGQLNYSTALPSSAPRLSMEMFAQHFGLNIHLVSYKNTIQAITDVAAGHVPMAFSEAGAAQQFIRSNRLRALAVSSLTRFNSLPDVPTLAEATGRPGLEAVSWHALMAPSATPRSVVNRLHGEMTRIMKMPEVTKAIANLDLIPLMPASVEDTQQYIAAETKKWGDLVRKLGLAGSQ
jgi:tripartite-type tricarboxylate transporter receptor subunit TctC